MGSLALLFSRLPLLRLFHFPRYIQYTPNPPQSPTGSHSPRAKLASAAALLEPSTNTQDPRTHLYSVSIWISTSTSTWVKPGYHLDTSADLARARMQVASMSGSSTAIAVSKNRSNVTPFKTTPSKNFAPAAESPGNWQHPRIKEITRRQNRTVFTSDNVKTVIYNITALIIISFIQKINDDFGPRLL